MIDLQYEQEPRSCPIAMRVLQITALLAVIVSLLVPAVTAEANTLHENDRDVLSVGLLQSYRTWRIDDSETGVSRTVQQYAIQQLSTIKVLEQVDLVVYTAGGFSQDRGERVDEIAGLADAKLKSFGYFWNRRILLTLGVNVPVGRTRLDDSEIRAVSAISQNILGFRMKRYGEGLDVDFGATIGYSLTSGWTVGGGFSYLGKGSYDLDSSTRYTPGDEVALTVGVDWVRGTWLLTFDTVLRLYGEDNIGDEARFRDGDQLEMTSRIIWQPGPLGMEMFVRSIFKEDNTYSVQSPGSDTRVNNGQNFWLSWSPVYRPRTGVTLKGYLDYVAMDQSQQQWTSSWSLGYGFGADFLLNPATVLGLRVTRLTGGSEDDSISLSGFDGVLTLRWRF